MKTWALPDPPGVEVRHVVDRHGVVFRRDEHHDDTWWGDIGKGYEDYFTWPELLRRGPLTAKEN